MDKDAVIATLRAHRAHLERRGVIHIAFDLVDGKEIGVWEYAGLQRQIGELPPGEVDVILRDGAKPWLLAEIERDAIMLSDRSRRHLQEMRENGHLVSDWTTG